MAVYIIPPGIQQASVVEQTGLPLGRFGEREPPDVRAVAVGPVKHEVGEVTPAVLTADVRLQPSADKSDAADPDFMDSETRL